jgi:hypothetical protein
LRAGAAECRRKVRYGADLRFFIAHLRHFFSGEWDDGGFYRQLFAENHLESFAYTHLAELFSHHIGQRAVE